MTMPLHRRSMEQLLRAATICTEYGNRHNIQLHVLRLVLFGRQSAGKSRFMNAFAKRALGFMKNGTGTRCAVMYTFVAAKAGCEHCTVTWKSKKTEGIAPDRLYSEVDKVMAEIENGEKFSEEVLAIRLDLKDVVDLCIIDLPGLRPPHAQDAAEDNQKIFRIWRQFAADKHTVPVILTHLSPEKDEMESDLARLKEAIGASHEVLRRAVVVVGRLDDHIRRQDDSPLRMMQQLLERLGIGSKEKLVFLSLKPELYDRNVMEASEDSGEASATLNSYFAAIQSQDQEMISAHVPQQLQRAYLIGIGAAVDCLVTTIGDHLSANISTTLIALENHFRSVQDRVHALAALQDITVVRKQAEDFVSLFCSYLAALARWDMADFLQNVPIFEPGAVTAAIGLPVDELALVFDEEISRFGMEDAAFVKAFREPE
eukprot:RCo026412